MARLLTVRMGDRGLFRSYGEAGWIRYSSAETVWRLDVREAVRMGGKNLGLRGFSFRQNCNHEGSSASTETASALHSVSLHFTVYTARNLRNPFERRRIKRGPQSCPRIALSMHSATHSTLWSLMPAIEMRPLPVM